MKKGKTGNSEDRAPFDRAPFRRAIQQARRHIEAGRHQAAYEVLANLTLDARRASDARYLCLKVMLAMRLGWWREALELLQSLRRAGLERAVILLDQAICLIALGRLDEAEEVLRSDVLENRYPRDVLLARIAVERGDIAKAREHLLAAYRLDPAARSLALQDAKLAPLMADCMPRFMTMLN